ncbi:hypothetical protein BRD56_10480 [Thermoplasmatales archaeon SW_10_69_26]|nr:MAG: hypothetical protein BRD56_10480 [Thermoplasmatales archaeon SW_10_69_26]
MSRPNSCEAVTDLYEAVALESGRPKDPCPCEECEPGCELHTYFCNRLCVWCRYGDHATEGGPC